MHTVLARHPVVLTVFFVVYVALGYVGLSIGGFSGGTIAVWPGSGFALAALVVFSRRAWPAIVAGAALVLFAASGRIVWSLVIAVGYTLEAVVGAVLVERFAGGKLAFKTPDSIFRFVGIATFVSTPLSSAYGLVATVLFGPEGLSDLGYLWMTWWLANLSGILVVAPLAILWPTIPVTPKNLRLRVFFEAVVITTALSLVALVVFGGLFPADVKNYPLEFLCFPFLIWAAFRCGRRTVATATFFLSGIAVWGTTHGFGPFALESRQEALVLVQAYMAVIASTGTVLAAVVAEHLSAEERLRELATTDSLTGLANYRHLLDVLRAEIARSNRTSRPFSILFLDMNGLKDINDRFGHVTGSKALCRLADLLRASCRSIDTPARFGGDEFAVVLPETPESGGQVVLKRIVDRLAVEGGTPPLSVSGGVAAFPRDGSSPTQLLRAADTLLYEAKAKHVRKRPVQTETEQEPRTGTLF
jgi:diguanylate cyclase (GGDEF)-like protein